jgi:hypothetical protein
MPNKKRKTTRSPLKRKPLRSPGESLRDEIENLFSEELALFVYVPFMFVLFTIFEWIRWYFNLLPQPIIYSIATILTVAYSSFRIFRLRKRYRKLTLGLEGEKSVGQFLNSLHNEGWHILHDIPGDGFNIDHVVLSPHGIYTIETKTYSKPIRGEAVIKYDGTYVYVNGVKPKRDPIRQALATQDWLENILLATTDKQFPVKAVVLFPDWYVEPQSNKTKEAPWVLNPKALPKFIENQPIVIKQEDVALANSRLVEYISRHS